MGNIHLVSTNKQSRLHLGKSGLVLCDLNFGKNTINGQNIFISSDEEVKEGDWYYYKDKENYEHIFKWSSGFVDNTAKYGKKIILTTDGDLITDGIQAIDNEFLEWFVKNPSCESVEVTKEDWILNPYVDFFYKIIIPKEEPKQEQLEELAKDFYSNENQLMERIAFKRGYTECKENMYSEEEVLELLLSRPGPYLTDEEIKEWFEQFKKK
jgi:hypothetical protein